MGEPVYQGISKMQVMFGVVSEGLRPIFPPNTPPWYSQIADACWRQEPKRRYILLLGMQFSESVLLGHLDCCVLICLFPLVIDGGVALQTATFESAKGFLPAISLTGVPIRTPIYTGFL